MSGLLLSMMSGSQEPKPRSNEEQERNQNRSSSQDLGQRIPSAVSLFLSQGGCHSLASVLCPARVDFSTQMLSPASGLWHVLFPLPRRLFS